MPDTLTDLPGDTVNDESLLAWLNKLEVKVGWHMLDGRPVQVARDARAHRTPEPRYASAKFPFRSVYGLFELADQSTTWRRLDNRCPYLDLPNQHLALGGLAKLLVTIFESEG